MRRRCLKGWDSMLTEMVCRAYDGCSLCNRSETEVETIVSMALEEAGVQPPNGISFPAFEAALSAADLSSMQVDVCS